MHKICIILDRPRAALLEPNSASLRAVQDSRSGQAFTGTPAAVSSSFSLPDPFAASVSAWRESHLQSAQARSAMELHQQADMLICFASQPLVLPSGTVFIMTPTVAASDEAVCDEYLRHRPPPRHLRQRVLHGVAVGWDTEASQQLSSLRSGPPR